MTDPSRYDRLSPLARALVDDYDEIDLAEMLVKTQDELAAHRAAITSPRGEVMLGLLGALHQRAYDGTCSHCTGLYAVPYPCPTIQALDQSAPAATDAAEPAAWTPPPPGGQREQLPNHLLALIEPAPYLSTACQTADLLACAACFPGSGVPRPQYDELLEHAERLHQRCRLNHKFTGQSCACPCHSD